MAEIDMSWVTEEQVIQPKETETRSFEDFDV